MSSLSSTTDLPKISNESGAPAAPNEPPAKKFCSLFSYNYKRAASDHHHSDVQSNMLPETQLAKYIELINSDTYNVNVSQSVFNSKEYSLLQPLFSRV